LARAAHTASIDLFPEFVSGTIRRLREVQYEPKCSRRVRHHGPKTK
jgi:hypothetical protein